MERETGGKAGRHARMRVISGRINEQRRKVVAPLRRGVFLLPVTITSLGLLFGFYSLVSSINGHFELAAVLITIAFVCDGLDGRVARASRTSSEFGGEYDSLADIVAFGVAPACSRLLLGAQAAGRNRRGNRRAVRRMRRAAGSRGSTSRPLRPTSAASSGFRFPGAAAMIAGVALAYSYFDLSSPRMLCTVMAPITLALAGLMISRVPYPSFKVFNLHRRAPIELMIVVLLVAAMVFALPAIERLSARYQLRPVRTRADGARRRDAAQAAGFCARCRRPVRIRRKDSAQKARETGTITRARHKRADTARGAANLRPYPTNR